MPKTAIDYTRCIIYKLVCKDLEVKDLYIGHTTYFTMRKWGHKRSSNNEKDKSYNQKVYKIIRDNGGWDNWEMLIVEYYTECKNTNDARSRERYWYETLSATMNTNRPIITKEEFLEVRKDNAKRYYGDNKEEVLKQGKLYYEQNRKIINERNRLYNVTNKEELKARNKQYREQNKELIKIKSKQYYEKNKELIKLKQQLKKKLI